VKRLAHEKVNEVEPGLTPMYRKGRHEVQAAIKSPLGSIRAPLKVAKQ